MQRSMKSARRALVLATDAVAATLSLAACGSDILAATLSDCDLDTSRSDLPCECSDRLRCGWNEVSRSAGMKRNEIRKRFASLC